MAENDYDVVPYESFPYPNTHPEELYTVGKLFGLEAVNPFKCRVLELGCASGGNIIPMAVKYPDSEFVGIDLSKVQIEDGKKHIENLQLKNIELLEKSILDISEELGKFDYIITHGILSWVPKDVQDKIFAVSRANLNPNGIAYISYNTLPGWNIVKSIREMMLYHTARFDQPKDKIREARLLLNFIQQGNTAKESAYYKAIENEISILKNTGDSYLIHDHMEKDNEPFYFHDFMDKAMANNLQYLGDSSIATMFAGNFPKETSEILMGAGSDIVRVEQYMDFIRNRRFRSTLLCHKDVKLNRNLNSEKLKDFYVTSYMKSDVGANDIDLTSNKEVSFTSPGGCNVISAHPAVISSLSYLSGQKKPVAVKDLLQEVKKRLPSGNEEVIESLVLENLLRVVLGDGASLSSFPATYTCDISEKPKVSELTRYQATYSGWVTTQKSTRVNVDMFTKVIFQYLNGDNDVNAVVDHMIKHVNKNDFTLNEDGKKVEDKSKIKEKVELLTRKSLESFVNNGLLVA